MPDVAAPNGIINVTQQREPAHGARSGACSSVITPPCRALPRRRRQTMAWLCELFGPQWSRQGDTPARSPWSYENYKCARCGEDQRIS